MIDNFDGILSRHPAEQEPRRMKRPIRVVAIIAIALAAGAGAFYAYLDEALAGKLTRAILKPCARLTDAQARGLGLRAATGRWSNMPMLRDASTEVGRYVDAASDSVTEVKFFQEGKVAFSVMIYPDCEKAVHP